MLLFCNVNPKIIYTRIAESVSLHAIRQSLELDES